MQEAEPACEADRNVEGVAGSGEARCRLEGGDGDGSARIVREADMADRGHALLPRDLDEPSATQVRRDGIASPSSPTARAERTVTTRFGRSEIARRKGDGAREEIARQKEKNPMDFYEVDGFESGDVRKFFLQFFFCKEYGP